MRRVRLCLLAGLLLLSSVASLSKEKNPAIPKTCTEHNLLRNEKGKIVWFTHDQMKSMATKIVPPQVSGLLRAARLEGNLVVGVVVGTDGRVKCTWPITGHPMLAPDVLRAVQQWQFEPQYSNGKPVAFAGTLRFTFKHGFH